MKHNSAGRWVTCPTNLQARLREQRCRNERPAVIDKVNQLLSLDIHLEQFLPLEESDHLLRQVSNLLRTGKNVTCNIWPASERNDVIDALQHLDNCGDNRHVAVVQSYSGELGALRLVCHDVIWQALSLCKRAEEHAILVTEDVEHGLLVEHNDHNDEGEEVEEYVISAWGDFGDRLNLITYR